MNKVEMIQEAIARLADETGCDIARAKISLRVPSPNNLHYDVKFTLRHTIPTYCVLPEGNAGFFSEPPKDDVVAARAKKDDFGARGGVMPGKLLVGGSKRHDADGGDVRDVGDTCVVHAKPSTTRAGGGGNAKAPARREKRRAS